MVDSLDSLFLILFGAKTKARLSTHATKKSKMAGLLVGVACVLRLAFVFAPNNIKNPEYSER